MAFAVDRSEWLVSFTVWPLCHPRRETPGGGWVESISRMDVGMKTRVPVTARSPSPDLWKVIYLLSCTS